MKKYFLFMMLSVVLSFVLPMLVFGIIKLQQKDIKEEKSERVSVYFHNENKIKDLELEDYIYSVVAAEMPASFEIEALKAQAVAARSYTVYRKEHPTDKHPGAAVCTDYTHCKAYKTDEELKQQWKDKAKEYEKKIKNAVNSTKNGIITYGGEAALAVFHSQSGNGRTESSKDVWGGDVPYLVSVESYGEESAPNYYSTLSVTFQEFKEKIATLNPDIVLSSTDDIGETERSDGGGVKSILLAGVSVSGKDIRAAFNLRSTSFDIDVKDNTITFNVNGYGHGVGMSQYGANAMAKNGADYKEILAHYYNGTEIVFN